MSKLYQRELNKVQEQLDNIQEKFTNGLLSELEKVDAMLEYLDEYETKTRDKYIHLVTHDEVTGLPNPAYCRVRLLDNVRRANLLINYINESVNVYITK